jgi:hypothetical protein
VFDLEGMILKNIAEYGVFCGLFVWLLIYCLKENAKREGDYREIIKGLSDSFQKLSSEVSMIQETLSRITDRNSKGD